MSGAALIGRGTRPTTAGQRLAALAEGRWLVPLALVLAVVPLLWPTVPPLLDLPNSMSRYRIAQDLATSPYFHRWYDFHWALVGNLGVDLLVAVLGPVLGIEPATKLVVAMIPPLAVAGMALVAREAHGRVPATAPFAFVFANNFPFNFGFVNFCLSAALALLAFGLWLRMGRTDRTRLRALLFVPIAFAVWLAHVCGWGLLGIMIFSAEWSGRARARGWGRAFPGAALACVPLLAVLLPMLAWGAAPSFSTVVTPHFSLERKLALIIVSLKNDVSWIDQGSILVVWAMLVVALARKDIGFDRRLGCAAAMLLLTFLAMPDEIMGSGFADLRIAPYAVAMLMLAIRPPPAGRIATAIGVLAMAFLAARTAYQTATYLRLDRGYAEQLEAVDHIPVGARVFGFAKVGCLGDWRDDRMDHVNRLAIVRRQAYSNDTWPPSTAQGLTVRPALLAGYHDLDSQKWIPADCRFGTDHTVPGMLAVLPRDRFDYLWLIDLPPRLWPHRDWLQAVWQSRNGVLFRIQPAGGAAAPSA